jgi:hypothetical protein
MVSTTFQISECGKGSSEADRKGHLSLDHPCHAVIALAMSILMFLFNNVLP